MLPRKTSILLKALVTTFLISGSHTTLAKVTDRWEKREPQVTESQKAADAARAEREKELQAIRDAKKQPTTETKTTPEPEVKTPKEVDVEMKPAEVTTLPTHPVGKQLAPKPPSAMPEEKPANKPLTMKERIALNKQQTAEKFRKLHEMNKEKAATQHAGKPATAPSYRMSPTQRRIQEEADKVKTPKIHDEHITTTLPMPSKPTEKPLMEHEKVAADEPMKKGAMPAPKDGTKSLAMGPSQKKLQEEVEKKEAERAHVETPRSTVTTHPPVDLAHPPLTMKVEEHEHITTTLPMPEKAADTPTPHQATAPSKPGADSSRSGLLAEIQKGKQLRKVDTTKPASDPQATAPSVDLAHPPLTMKVEEHEHITTTLPMPEKAADTPTPHQATAPSKPGADSSKSDLLAEIRKGKQLRKVDTTKPASDPQATAPSVDLAPPPPPPLAMKVEEHEHITTTLPMPEKTAHGHAGTSTPPLPKGPTAKPGVDSSRSGLLAEIQAGKQLRKVDTTKPATEPKGDENAPTTPALIHADQLKAKIEARAKMTDEQRAASVEAIPSSKAPDERSAFLKEIQERAGKPRGKASPPPSVDAYEE